MTREVCSGLFDRKRTLPVTSIASHIEARTVMEILGHSQISHTLNIYTHVPSKTLQNAANVLSDAVYGLRLVPPLPPHPPNTAAVHHQTG